MLLLLFSWIVQTSGMAALEDFEVGSRHRGGGFEPRPHHLDELPGAHRARLARQMEPKPAHLLREGRTVRERPVVVAKEAAICELLLGQSTEGGGNK
jgi:hypothetical protein